MWVSLICVCTWPKSALPPCTHSRPSREPAPIPDHRPNLIGCHLCTGRPGEAQCNPMPTASVSTEQDTQWLPERGSGSSSVAFSQKQLLLSHTRGGGSGEMAQTVAKLLLITGSPDTGRRKKNRVRPIFKSPHTVTYSSIRPPYLK